MSGQQEFSGGGHSRALVQLDLGHRDLQRCGNVSRGDREKERRGCPGWRNYNVCPETEQGRSCKNIEFLQEAQQQLCGVVLVYSAQLFTVLECSLLLSHSCSRYRKGLQGLIWIPAAEEMEQRAKGSAVCAAASSSPSGFSSQEFSSGMVGDHSGLQGVLSLLTSIFINC